MAQLLSGLGGPPIYKTESDSLDLEIEESLTLFLTFSLLYTVKPGVSKLFLVNNLALVNIFCFPKSHFQHKSPKDSKQPGVSKLFAA